MKNGEAVFGAPWGVALKAMTSFFVVFFLAIVGVAFSRIGPVFLWARVALTLVPLLVGMVSALFMVRGYSISGRVLSIQRLLWATKLDLTGAVSVIIDPDALGGSTRVFGNGGLFSFTGWYRNKKLGSYRAYVTDAKRAVVVRLRAKTIVVSPDDPQRFAAEISARLGQE